MKVSNEGWFWRGEGYPWVTVPPRGGEDRKTVVRREAGDEAKGMQYYPSGATILRGLSLTEAGILTSSQ